MTIIEYAERWGCHEWTVRQAIKEGRIKAEKIPKQGGGFRFDIPADQLSPFKKEKHKKATQTPAKYKQVLADKKEWIRQNAECHTVKRLAEELGITCPEVRAIYDEIYNEGRNAE